MQKQTKSIRQACFLCMLAMVSVAVACTGSNKASKSGRNLANSAQNVRVDGGIDAILGSDQGSIDCTGNDDESSDTEKKFLRVIHQTKAEEKTIIDHIFSNPDEGSSCTPQAGIKLLRRLTNAEYKASVVDLIHDDKAGSVADSFPPQTTVQGFDNNAHLNVIGQDHVLVYWLAANKLAELVVEKFYVLMPCKIKDESCANKFGTEFGKKVYRRPLKSDEINALMAIFRLGNAEKGFNEGIKLLATALFNSPHFLYRTELGEASQGAEGVSLTSYEIVSALSYLFLGTTPDDALLAIADKKPQMTENDIEALAIELLNDPRSSRGISQFADSYMHIRDLFNVAIKGDLFPQFTAQVREEMAKETRDYFRTIILDQEGSFNELFTSNFTVTDSKKLQAIYGGTLSADPEKPRLSYNDKERLGLLAHGTFLAGHSHGETTSPVLRGAFVLESILCDVLLPPPPSLNIMPPKLDPLLTTQERFKAHSQRPGCASCHVRIDGMGFGLEGYDPIGRVRNSENAKPIDTKGIAFLEEGQSSNFSGVAELAKLIGASSRAKGCFAIQWYRHSVGRPIYESDVCQLKKINLATNNEDKLRKLLGSLVANYGFLHRKP